MPYVPTTAWYAMACKREREKMFYEKCANCRETIIQQYGSVSYSNVIVDKENDGVTRYKRYCVRRKCFVEDYNTCEDWMPKNNV